MATLASLNEAKTHLRIPLSDTNRDADVQAKLDEANGTILDYLGTDADDTWDTDTVPGPVKASILIMLGNLYENRGDDMKADENAWAAVYRYCTRLRTSALA